MDDGGNQEAAGVGEDVALAAPHQLGGVKAPDATAFCRLYRPAVDRSGGRRCLAADRFMRQHRGPVPDRGPPPRLVPAAEAVPETPIPHPSNHLANAAPSRELLADGAVPPCPVLMAAPRPACITSDRRFSTFLSLRITEKKKYTTNIAKLMILPEQQFR